MKRNLYQMDNNSECDSDTDSISESQILHLDSSNDKKKCVDNYWSNTTRANIQCSNKYTCYIHHNDEYICAVYECKGIKVDNLNHTESPSI